MNAELRNIFLRTISATNPGKLLGSWLSTNGPELKVADLTFPLNHNCYLVGFGKAVYGMAVEIENIVGNHLQKGIISVPVGYRDAISATGLGWSAPRLGQNSTIKVIEGGKNNLPDANSFKAAVEIKGLAEQRRADELLFVLISGGGSALLSYPVPPLSVEQKSDFIRRLSSAGASIAELNVLRKMLSKVKGGKLAMSAFPCPVVAFILSDIVGDPVDLIASGPTALSPDLSSDEAFSILNKYGLGGSIGNDVRRALLRSQEPEEATLGATNSKYGQYFTDKVRNIVVGNNATVLNGIKKEAALLGHSTVILSRRVDGSVDGVVKVYAELIKLVISLRRCKDKAYFLSGLKSLPGLFDADDVPYVGDILGNIADSFDILDAYCAGKMSLLLICGGEPTVKVRGNGVGGRNQELALRMAVELSRLKCNDRRPIDFDSVFFASIGTDGIDGPTDAAGAIADANLVEDAVKQGLNPSAYLLNNDSYTFFSLFKDGDQLIKCGHTGMNVMDVHIIFFNINCVA